MHVVCCMCSWQINDDDDDDEYAMGVGLLCRGVKVNIRNFPLMCTKGFKTLGLAAARKSA